MKNERLDMSTEQMEKLSNMLQQQGLSKTEIDVILNGEYESYDSKYDLESSFGGLKKHDKVLEKLSDGYTMDELRAEGVSQQQIDAFSQMLQEKNLNADQAKAIYQYSVDSNTILGIKRGETTVEAVQENIIKEIGEHLQERGVGQEDVQHIIQYIKSIDYQNTALHDNYDKMNQYMREKGLPETSYVIARRGIMDINRSEHISETINQLEEGLKNTNLPKSMKLYRAINTSYLKKGLKDGEGLESLIGKSIGNKGQTSTSPLYDCSFATHDECDTVFEIYTPRGSRGSYVAELSAYDTTEQEVLLDPNDLYITGVQTGVVDKNGRTKNVLKALCLSQDRECYKGIDKQQDVRKTENSQSNYDRTIEGTESNLPMKQSRFSKFFNQFRARFARQNRSNNGMNTNTNSQRRNPFSRRKQEESQYNSKNTPEQQTFQPKQKSQEKKSWELEPEEKARIQRETAEIAKRFREQEEQQKQAPAQEMQQGNIQQGDFTQMQQGQIPQQIPQQPMQDFGGMEL